MLAEHRLQNVKVYGAHLGGDDGPALPAHLLGEHGAVVCSGPGLGVDILVPAHVHGGDKAAHPDTGGTQIVHFVYLQNGVQLAAALQYLGDLVGGDGIQTAAEGVELDELQVVPVGDELRCGVESGVVDPLVVGPDGAAGDKVYGKAVLSKDGEAVGGYELGDTVVYLRVDVVGTSRQDYAPAALLFHLFQKLCAPTAHVVLGPVLLGPGQLYRMAHFLLRNVPLFPAELHQPVGGHPLAGKGYEGADIAHVTVGHGLHIVFQVLRVGDYHRAVIVVLGSRGLLVLVKDAGVEDSLDALVDEPLDMAVGQLCRIALRLRGDGLHAQLVNLPGGEGRELHSEAQGLEEGGPEGVVLPHVQHPGYTNDAPGSILQRGIVEDTLLLVFHHAGGPLQLRRAAQAPLAAVAGDMAAAAGELVYRKQAIVGAAAAAGGSSGVLEIDNLLQGQHAALLAGIAFPGDESGAEGTHYAGDIRAGDLHPGYGLKGPEHRFIIEGAALDHNVAAQLGGIGELYDLIKGVFDDGIGKTGGNVLNGGPFLLGLLYVGIHEHGAAGAQIHRVLGKKGLLCKVLCAVAQGICKVFDKGAAAGGAGLIQKHGVHGVVLQLYALHVLATDVQHTVHMGVEEGGGGAVGNGLHLPLVQGEGGFQQVLAVAGGAGADYAGPLRKQRAQLVDGLHGGAHGVPLVI